MVRLRLAAGALAASVCAQALCETLALRVESAEEVFTPLHSYAVGEVEGDPIFFAGISGMGLHARTQNGTEIGFPTSVFSDEIHLFDVEAGVTHTGGTAHLSDDVRRALLVTNAAHVQIGGTLYMFGGYGPTLDGTDWNTRGTVTAIDLAMVKEALETGVNIPEGAFNVMTSAEAQVAGAKCVRLGDDFALIGGADFAGDYGDRFNFAEAYSHEIHLFDPAVSVVTPAQTFSGTVSLSDPFRRRDLNAAPATLPGGQGGLVSGFAILGGVFKDGITAWTTPMIHAQGDAEVTHVVDFQQKMHQYEGPAASFYSESLDQNRFVLMSGLSAHTWDGQSFQPIFGGLWNIPWTAEITDITMEGGAFTQEIVTGAMPLPMVNGELVLAEGIPTNESGQVLLDELPAREILLGRIFGGLKAATASAAPSTWASNQVLEVSLLYGVEGDLSRDGVVGSQDLGLLLGSWGTSSDNADMDGDGVVGSRDLAIILGLWGNGGE